MMGFDVAKLPAYVYEDKDRKGRVRYRIRKPGMPSRTIKADPTSKAFRDAYNAYLDGAEPVTAPKNSFEWLVGEYLHNLQRMVKNGQAAPATYKQRRLQLGKISKDNGDRDAFALTPKAVRRIIGELAATPAVANNVLKSLRAMYKWAVESGMTDINPTMGVPSLFKQWEGESQKIIKAKGRELDGVVHDGYPEPTYGITTYGNTFPQKGQENE